MTKDAFAASFEFLHPSIRDLGLEQFMMNWGADINLQQSQLRAFKGSWTKAFMMYLRLQKHYWPLLVAHYIFNLFGIMMPCYYYFVEGSVQWGLQSSHFL